MEKDKKIQDELFLRILNNDASESEKKVFQEWINQDCKNSTWFSEMESLWSKSKNIDDYYKISQEKAWNIINGKIRKKRMHKIYAYAYKSAAAIILAFMALTSTIYFIHSGYEKEYAKEISVSAPLGSKTSVTLSDGTSIWLNSGSEIRYPSVFNKKAREVYLKGEAYFCVSKNKKRPFIVHADKVFIKVFGTKFDVKAYPEENTIETFLEEGSIGIGMTGCNQELILKPDEGITYSKSDSKFNVINKDKCDQYTLWRCNKLIFKRETFGDLAVKLERWHNVKIIINNKKLANKRITGAFENESVEQIFEALKISVPLQYNIDKNTITIN